MPAAYNRAELEAEAERTAGRYANGPLGCGARLNYATPQEWACELKSLHTYLRTFTLRRFPAWPIAIVDRFPGAAGSPEGAVLEDITLLARLRDEYKAELVIISDSDSSSLANAKLRLPSGAGVADPNS